MGLMLAASIVRTGRLGRLLAVALLAWGLMFALLAFTSAVQVAIARLAVGRTAPQVSTPAERRARIRGLPGHGGVR